MCWCLQSRPIGAVHLLDLKWSMFFCCRQFPGGSIDGPSRCRPTSCHSALLRRSIHESWNSWGMVEFPRFSLKFPAFFRSVLSESLTHFDESWSDSVVHLLNSDQVTDYTQFLVFCVFSFDPLELHLTTSELWFWSGARGNIAITAL